MENKKFIGWTERAAKTVSGKMRIAYLILDDKQFEKTILFAESDTGRGVTSVILSCPLNIMPKTLRKKFEDLRIGNVQVYQGYHMGIRQSC
jgi:hypothetical protein